MTITASPAAVRPKMMHNVLVTDHAWDRIIDMCEHVHVTEDIVRRMATDFGATVTKDREYSVVHPLSAFIGEGILRDSDMDDRWLIASTIQPELLLVVARPKNGQKGMSIVTIMYNADVVRPGHPAYADMRRRKGA